MNADRATLARKLRFSDVVYAIDTTPKSLRLWLQRKQVKIATPEKSDGGWAEYSIHDISILALVRKLVDFGVDVSTASEIANKTMSDYFFQLPMHVRNPEKMPAFALPLHWHNTRLWIHRTSLRDWALTIAPLWTSPAEPDSAYLSIDVATVLQTAIKRALESADEGAGDDDD